MTYFCRISIADDIFTTGDGRLHSAKVTLAEGQDASVCNFSILDGDRKFLDKYMAYAYAIGGLAPLRPPESRREGTAAERGSATSNGSLSVNMRAMLDTIAWAEGAGYNTLFGGGTFEGYADHPRQVIRRSGFSSSASGRYQFLQDTWDETSERLGLSDFSPESQDLGAVDRIRFRGSTDEVEAGDVRGALTGDGSNGSGLAYEWASLPPYRYPGQGTKTMDEVEDYFRSRVEYYSQGAQAQESAVESVADAGSVISSVAAAKSASNSGSQILVEEGYAGKIITASSYVHISLRFSMFDARILEFGGIAASWSLTRRSLTTAYQNVTLKDLATTIAAAHGLTLSYQADLNPKYEYFSQRGISDYDSLLIEVRRLGLRMSCVGRELRIYDLRSKLSQQTASEEIVIRYGENLGMSFNVSHQAQSETSPGGARSSNPNERSQTGTRKTDIDPATGQIKISPTAALETMAGAGLRSLGDTNRGGAVASITPISSISSGAAAADTLSTDSTPKPSTAGIIGSAGSQIAQVKPKVQGSTDSGAEQSANNSDRIKGITAEFSAPLTSNSVELLTLDPDTTLSTKGISEFCDRIWVVDTVTRSYSTFTGSQLSCTLYTPIKNKFPAPTEGEGNTRGNNPENEEPPPLNPNGFINPTTGVKTSGFRTARRPNHQGVDIADALGTPVWASADGVVSSAVNNCSVGNQECGGGYGNRVYIEHADGFQTRYAHLKRGSVTVTDGQTVKQGQKIGEQDNTGHSRGVHLHFEIRKNGEPQNPENYITI